jgi:tetratricopeptide (TPR) repeat protein
MNKHVKKICLTSFVIFIFCCLSAQVDEMYLKGVAALIKQQYEEASLYLSNAIDRNNSDDRYYLKRAESYLYQGKFELAVSDYEEANSIKPECGDIGLARTYTQLGDYPKAFLFLNRNLQSEYRVPESLLKKDPAFDPLKQKDEWHDLWQQDWYNDLEKLTAEVEYQIRKGNPEAGIKYLDDNLSAFIKASGFYALRARVYYLQENYAAAVADYSIAISLNKIDPELYFNRGMAFLRSNNFRNAADDFSRGLKTEPDRFEFYLERARAYTGLMEYNTALKDAEFYLMFFNDDQQAITLCGEISYQNQDYINALKYFNKNLKSDQNNPDYYKARGKTYLKTKTFTYAINDLSMALDLKPDDGEAYLYLGLAKYETGDKVGACSDLQKAQRYGNTLALKYILEYCGK